MRGILWAAAGTTEIVCSPSPAPAVAITTPWLSLSGPDWLYTNIGSIAMYRLQAIVIGTSGARQYQIGPSPPLRLFKYEVITYLR